MEVTSLQLDGDGSRAGSEQLDELVRTELDDVRTIRRSVQEQRSDVIITEAHKGYDLLVVAADERSSNGHGPVFGDTVDAVVKDAPCSVLVVSGPAEDETDSYLERVHQGHILVPIAGSDYDRHAAEVAFAIAAGRDAVVDLVHVVSAPQHLVRVSAGQAMQNAVGIGEDLVEGVAELGRALGATVNTDVLVADHPENAIVERAERRGDLIVLASGRRPVTQRAFFGHRVDFVVGNASCPVVVVSVR